MECKEIRDLTNMLKENGDKLLDASSKLSISISLLQKMNESFKTIFNYGDSYASSFHVLPENDNIIDQFLDLRLLYDFVQKTIGLKLFTDTARSENLDVDISIFRNLKLLEVHRFSTNFLRGLKNLRTHLEYLICIKSASTLKDVLENCGGDRVQGYIWNELKEVVFTHNGINDLDGSLEFVPLLNSIDLSHNRIQNAEYINCLSNLRFLNLGFNHLNSVPSFNGQLCSAIQVLILRNNYIDDIKEISALINLHELDISNNCLLDHSYLAPLTALSRLQKLKLQGNPLSYHPCHRNKTVMYLHVHNPADFILENLPLRKSELRLVGSLHSTYQHLERSCSSNSISTLTTVVPVETTSVNRTVIANNSTTDADISDEEPNSTCNKNETTLNDNISLSNPLGLHEYEGMMDSGFVTEPRPASPSEGSIENPTHVSKSPIKLLVVAEIHKETVAQPCSAASLQSSHEETIKYCESDIEILSNPSQSSIEVISGPRYVHSSSAILTEAISETNTNVDLKVTMNEMHKSL